MKKSKIPTILGIFFLVLGIAFGVVLINSQQIFRLRASPEISPKDVRISNITDTSFTVSWTTDKQTQCFIQWGEEKTSLNKTQLDPSTSTSFTHSLTLTGLSPSTIYFFKINSDGRGFDNNGIPWQIKTGVEIPAQPEANIISGTVMTQTGSPVKGALVYVTLGGSSLLSGITSEDGGWVIPISTARTQTLTSFIPISETTLIEISVQGGPLGVSSAQIYPTSAKPSPPIILGQTHNFKTLRPEKEGLVPEADVALPEESSPSSRFVVPEVTPTLTSTVTLENLKEGEILNELKPLFSGEGPAGVTLTIKIESDPLSDQVKIGSDEAWSWTPPTNLTPGTHKITLQWKDNGGILRILTRTFIVQAAEEPSATPTPTPTPTVTPSPTPTPSPSQTPTPTPKVATESALPASGILTPTLVLFIISLASLIFGGAIFALSLVLENGKSTLN